MNQEEQVLDTQEVMQLLRVSRPTVHAMIREGFLRPLPYSQALKRPRKNFFRREDVDRVLRERRASAEQQRKAS